MSDVNKIKIQVIEILQEILDNDIDVETIASSENLMEEGILDSMSVVDVVIQIEEKFKIELKNEDMLLDNFKSVDKIIECVEEYLDAK